MRLLTPENVAALFSLKIRQVKELARQGEIPAVKVGRLWRFPEEALQKWLVNKSNAPLGDVGPIVDRIIREVS